MQFTVDKFINRAFAPCSYFICSFLNCRLNRDRKFELESDWSDKKESDDMDTFNVGLRNEHTNKQFHPGAAVFQEVWA